MLKKHVTRFLSIIFMVLISVGFISGIGSSTDKINYSMSDYYRAQNVGDFILKSKKSDGFTEEEIAALRNIYGEDNVATGMSFDVKLNVGGGEQLTRLYFLDGYSKEEWTVNVPELREGEYPADFGTQALCEMADNNLKGYAVGTEIELDFKNILEQLAEQGGQEMPSGSQMLDRLEKVKLTVSGILKSPLLFANDGEPSYTNPEDFEMPSDITSVNNLITLDNVLYLSTDVIPTYKDIMSFLPDTPLLGTGDIFIAVKHEDRDIFNAFDKRYETFIEEQKTLITEALDGAATSEETDKNDVRILTLYDNYSFVSLNAYGEKVKGIGIILMVAFLFVTALVVLSNMTRLMEEERGQTACLRTLGYSSFKIIFKYILFFFLSTGIGGGGAYFVGLGLAHLIYYVFNYSFTMPAVSSHVALVFFLITFTVIVVTTLSATLIAGGKMMREAPANLLRPKPPKAGKKVFLERIPLIWNRLSFKYKSTMRNVLRYLNRFVMTVVAVAVSTALVLAGFALLDVCLFGGINSPSVMGVAVIVVVFAGLLTTVVIYTLTNINVSERNRELATLMVLGYHGKEVSGYIFREVYIDTIVGIIFGYPLSLGIMYILFDIMAVGSIAAVSWFWWLAAPFVVLLFTFIVTLALRRKIVKIDMNESLKAIE